MNNPIANTIFASGRVMQGETLVDALINVWRLIKCNAELIANVRNESIRARAGEDTIQLINVLVSLTTCIEHYGGRTSPDCNCDKCQAMNEAVTVRASRERESNRKSECVRDLVSAAKDLAAHFVEKHGPFECSIDVQAVAAVESAVRLVEAP